MNYVVGGTLLTFAGTNIINNIVISTLHTLYSSVIFVTYGSESNVIINKIKTDIEKLDIKLKLDLVNKLTIKLLDNDIHKIIVDGVVDIISNIKSNIDNSKFGGFGEYEFSSSVDPTGSYLAPYITTIGIYDDDLNMVAVAKLPQPIKSLPEYPVNFIVRFDT